MSSWPQALGSGRRLVGSGSDAVRGLLARLRPRTLLVAVPLVAAATLLLVPTAPRPSPSSTPSHPSAGRTSAAGAGAAVPGGSSATAQPERQSLAGQGGAVTAADRAPTISSYTVQSGDNLTTIAAQFGTDVTSLEAINGLNEYSVLQIGQRLTVIHTIGYLYTVKDGDTLGGIAGAGGVTLAALEAANDLGPGAGVAAGARLVIPSEPVVTQPNPPAAAGGGSASLIWPVHGVITSPFGWRPDPWTNSGVEFHHGLDIGVPMYTPVVAACSGRVVLAAWDGGYGDAVEVQCGNGLLTLYAHNARFASWAGESVSQGGLIAYSGMTGNATGPHVHFGVSSGGVWQNPLNYLP